MGYKFPSPVSLITLNTVDGPLQESRRSVNMSRSVQTRWEKESREATQQRTEYDFDKEKWMKQMRIETMDCIVDPEISPIRYTSFKGIKRAMERFVTMRKLRDRRPDFDPAQLKEQFVTLKTISHARNTDMAKSLQRLTTTAEADRITKEIKARMNEDFTSKSWKALKQQNLSAQTPYKMEVLSFDLVHCYMGQMSKEDWLQLTYRCEFRELDMTAASKGMERPFVASKDVADNEEEGWVKQLEYPVFEVRLTDGMDKSQPNPFKIVGVMKKDGSRYGKDAQDASALRKQFDRSKKWF